MNQLNSGCGGSAASDDPADMIGIEGSVASSAPPVLPAPGAVSTGEGAGSAAPSAVSARRAIAVDGDLVFLFLDGVHETSSQIKAGKYTFFGGFKGRRVTLRFGLTTNDVYAGIIDRAATGVITLPAFDEYAVIAKRVIDAQAAEGRVKYDDIVLSNARIDLTSIINKVRVVSEDRFSKEPDVYGTSKQQLLAKINSSAINESSAFGSSKYDVFAPIPKVFLMNPKEVSLGRGEKTQFTVSMSNFVDKSVIFKVNGVTGGTSATGTIGVSGTFTAPDILDNQKMVTVTAHSVEDSTYTASSTVTLTPVTVILNNGGPLITLTQFDSSFQVPYRISGHSDKRLRWFVNDIEYGNILSVGYISSAGNYTKPSKTPKIKVFVKAVSVADPTKYGVCEITQEVLIN